MANATTHRNSRIPSLVSALAILALVAGAVQGQGTAAIPGWSTLTTDGNEYTIATEPLHRFGGNGSMGVALASRVASPSGSALVLQSIRADEFRGRRIRFAGWLRSEDVEGQAGLFAHVDGAGTVETSDYMIGRSVIGTTAWRHYEIVLDVPRDAVGITFGVHLTGTGQVYGDDCELEAVEMGVALTGRAGNVLLPNQSLAADGNGGGGVIQAGAPRSESRVLLETQQRKYSRAPLRAVNLDFEQVPRM